MQTSQTSQTLIGSPIVQRAIGIATLQRPAVVAIARDPRATTQAAIVVAVVALANALGSAPGSFREFVLAIVIGIAGWLIFSTLAFFLSTNIFGTPTTHATVDSLIRTLGFARGPAIFGIVGFIPFFGNLAAAISGIWMLVTCVFVVRYTLGLSVMRAILTVLIAGAITGLVSGLLSLILGVSLGLGVSF